MNPILQIVVAGVVLVAASIAAGTLCGRYLKWHRLAYSRDKYDYYTDWDSNGKQ